MYPVKSMYRLSRLHSLCRFHPPQQTLAKLRAHINGLRVLALSGVRLAKSTLARRPQPRTCGSLQRLFGGTCELLSAKFDSNLFHPQIPPPHDKSSRMPTATTLFFTATIDPGLLCRPRRSYLNKERQAAFEGEGS